MRICFRVKESGKLLSGFLVTPEGVIQVKGCVDVSEELLSKGFVFKGEYKGREFEYRFEEVFDVVELSEKELLFEASELDLKLIEQLIFHKLNEFRESNDLKPLNWSEKIAEAAREKSMFLVNEFSHDSGKNAYDLLRERGIYFLTVGENIYRISGLKSTVKEEFVAERCVESWKKSRGHRKVMLQDFSHAGVGCFAKGKSVYVTLIAILNNYTISSSFKKGQEIFIQPVDEEFEGVVKVRVRTNPKNCFEVEDKEFYSKDDVIVVRVLRDCDGVIEIEYPL
ncbi:SCP-like extracellular [Ferroglobus placidus DSM 10642]|uniref:SCP-like extracellular n=1 Tax=Ferroglobus placidus (strain DSM 10642 / AEDII12DO) TaxID=589924 RepID=D3RZ53_FERPA|nr:CAP domain-containing protein [Ferroglobus placidus]ADC65766.1 SCP-like extracellular [Ferroglobus placidus DSM 10642]